MATICRVLLTLSVLGIRVIGRNTDIEWNRVEDGTAASLMSNLVALNQTRAPRRPDVQPHTVRFLLQAFSRIARCDRSGQGVAYNQRFVSVGGVLSCNVVLELRGARWGHSTDQLSVLGAHHDVINGTTGVNDNSAGVAVLLEVGKRLAARRRLNTVILVSFDREEENLGGSKVFLEEKLIPDILEPFNITSDTFHGAYILDTILNYDDTPNSQDADLLQRMYLMVPEEVDLVTRNQLRGDFLVAAGRHQADSALLKLAQKHWRNVSGSLLPDLSNSHSLIMRTFAFPDLVIGFVGDLLRSDHANFWRYKGPYVTGSTRQGLKALFFTDTANYRGYMQQCYHRPCDDLSHVTAKRLDFLSITTTCLSNLLLEVSGSGACSHTGNSTFGILLTLGLACILS